MRPIHRRHDTGHTGVVLHQILEAQRGGLQLIPADGHLDVTPRNLVACERLHDVDHARLRDRRGHTEQVADGAVVVASGEAVERDGDNRAGSALRQRVSAACTAPATSPTMYSNVSGQTRKLLRKSASDRFGTVVSHQLGALAYAHAARSAWPPASRAGGGWTSAATSATAWMSNARAAATAATAATRGSIVLSRRPAAGRLGAGGGGVSVGGCAGAPRPASPLAPEPHCPTVRPLRTNNTRGASARRPRTAPQLQAAQALLLLVWTSKGRKCAYGA